MSPATSQQECSGREEVDPPKCQRQAVDFSIDAILGISVTPKHAEKYNKLQHLRESSLPHYGWLDCTRYHPPKLPRCRKELQRCKYRNPRVPFSKQEVELLEQQFQQNLYLSTHRTAKLAESLSMSPKRVKIWFQNRRARLRKEQEQGNPTEPVAHFDLGHSNKPTGIPSNN